MKKDIAIAILAVVAAVALLSVRDMSTEASYWMKRCNAAEKVILQVEDDNLENYYTDGLDDSSVYHKWLDIQEVRRFEPVHK